MQLSLQKFLHEFPEYVKKKTTANISSEMIIGILGEVSGGVRETYLYEYLRKTTKYHSRNFERILGRISVEIPR